MANINIQPSGAIGFVCLIQRYFARYDRIEVVFERNKKRGASLEGLQVAQSAEHALLVEPMSFRADESAFVGYPRDWRLGLVGEEEETRGSPTGHRSSPRRVGPADLGAKVCAFSGSTMAPLFYTSNDQHRRPHWKSVHRRRGRLSERRRLQISLSAAQ